jgi:protein tyrosine/serine phosphatase
MPYKRTSARAYAGAFVLGLSLAASVAAEPVASHKAAAAVAIENFGKINDNYYRGAQPKGRDYADLAALGVRTVIDLTEGDDAGEPGSVQAAGMRFYRIPMTTHAQPAPEAVTQFLGLVNDPANQPVFVHCAGGHHRTGIMTAVYRMTQDGWTADRAFGEMQQFGFGPAFLHSELKSFVYDYYGGIDHVRASAQPAAAPVSAPAAKTDK